MSGPVVRFAPSPTGRIHIGNARTALFNYLVAARAMIGDEVPTITNTAMKTRVEAPRNSANSRD